MARAKKQKGYPPLPKGSVWIIEHHRHGTLKVEITGPDRYGPGWPLVKVLEHVKVDWQNSKAPSVGSEIPVAAIMATWEEVTS
jgi:hypothetical protein